MPHSVPVILTSIRRKRSDALSGGADEAIWIIALSLLAYPLLGTLIAFTSLPSLVASLPVRAIVLLLSISLIAKTKSAVWTTPNVSLFFAFWLLYFLRLLWDMFIAGIPAAGDYMFTFVAFCIPPALALMHRPAVNEEKLTKLLVSLGAVTCILAILAANTDLAGERSFVEETEGRLFLDTVNPITFGHVGVITLLAALSLTRYCSRAVEWIFATAAAALGIVTIQIASSRGPLFALSVCILAAALFNKRYRWLLLFLVAGSLIVVTGWSDESQNLLASRVALITQSEGPDVRTLMMAGAFQQFLDSPLVGSAVIELQFEDYPHNPFLEAAMATGIGGLLIFLVIFFNALNQIFKTLRSGSLLLPLLAIQALIAAQVSGSLPASTSLWIMLAMFAGTARRKKRPLPNASVGAGANALRSGSKPRMKE